MSYSYYDEWETASSSSSSSSSPHRMTTSLYRDPHHSFSTSSSSTHHHPVPRSDLLRDSTTRKRTNTTTFEEGRLRNTTTHRHRHRQPTTATVFWKPETTLYEEYLKTHAPYDSLNSTSTTATTAATSTTGVGVGALGTGAGPSRIPLNASPQDHDDDSKLKSSRSKFNANAKSKLKSRSSKRNLNSPRIGTTSPKGNNDNNNRVAGQKRSQLAASLSSPSRPSAPGSVEDGGGDEDNDGGEGEGSSGKGKEKKSYFRKAGNEKLGEGDGKVMIGGMGSPKAKHPRKRRKERDGMENEVENEMEMGMGMGMGMGMIGDDEGDGGNEVYNNKRKGKERRKNNGDDGDTGESGINGGGISNQRQDDVADEAATKAMETLGQLVGKWRERNNTHHPHHQHHQPSFGGRGVGMGMGSNLNLRTAAGGTSNSRSWSLGSGGPIVGTGMTTGRSARTIVSTGLTTPGSVGTARMAKLGLGSNAGGGGSAGGGIVRLGGGTSREKQKLLQQQRQRQLQQGTQVVKADSTPAVMESRMRKPQIGGADEPPAGGNADEENGTPVFETQGVDDESPTVARKLVKPPLAPLQEEQQQQSRPPQLEKPPAAVEEDEFPFDDEFDEVIQSFDEPKFLSQLSQQKSNAEAERAKSEPQLKTFPQLSSATAVRGEPTQQANNTGCSASSSKVCPQKPSRPSPVKVTQPKKGVSSSSRDKPISSIQRSKETKPSLVSERPSAPQAPKQQAGRAYADSMAPQTSAQTSGTKAVPSKLDQCVEQVPQRPKYFQPPSRPSSRNNLSRTSNVPQQSTKETSTCTTNAVTGKLVPPSRAQPKPKPEPPTPSAAKQAAVEEFKDLLEGAEELDWSDMSF